MHGRAARDRMDEESGQETMDARDYSDSGGMTEDCVRQNAKGVELTREDMAANDRILAKVTIVDGQCPDWVPIDG